jgi:serine/threonine protein phosphatase PrpC
MIRIEATFGSDKGLVRADNNDCVHIDKELALYMVCDGVGIKPSAGVASQIVCKEIQLLLSANRKIIQTFIDRPLIQNRGAVSTLISEVIQKASKKIFDQGQSDPNLAGMTTTLDMVLFAGPFAFIGHVGDSRVYLFRNKKVYQLTQDHNYMTELITKENRSLEEAKKHIYAGVLTRAMGLSGAIQSDLIEVELSAHDTFLICTDGIYRYFNTQELNEKIQLSEVPLSLEYLISEGKKRGGRDNLSGILLDCYQEKSQQKAELFDRIESLKKLPLFNYLDYQELLKVLNTGQTKSLKAGDLLVKEESEGNSMFVVSKGSIQIHKQDQKITVLGPGQAIGEMSLIANLPRSASATALEDSVVLEYQRQDLFDLFRKEQAISVKFFWALSRELTNRLRSTTTELAKAKKDLEVIKKDLPFRIE